MTARKSKLLRAISEAIWRKQSEEPVLTLADVLEEEYAALEGRDDLERAQAQEDRADAFVADDIADFHGLAQALLTGIARDSGEERLHPPMPESTPVSRISAVVIPDRGARLRTLRVDPEEGRRYLAERLTGLIRSNDLHIEEDPRFAPFLDAVSEDEAADTIVRRRRLLECAFSAYLRTSEDRRILRIRRLTHARSHAALCLSGGGIRSASFALGVVQGLARRGLLPRFHYLSTVSGGGYTGSWLSAWMAREGADRVHEQLRGPRVGKTVSEPQPVRHIRSYSYYLTPSFGFLSADTWTLIATIARNILLVWLVTVPLMAAALMLPRTFVTMPLRSILEWRALGLRPSDWRSDVWDPANVTLLVMLAGTALVVAAISFVLARLYSYNANDDSASRHAVTLRDFNLKCLAPLVAGAFLLGQAWEMIWAMLRLKLEPNMNPALISHAAWAQDFIKAQIDPGAEMSIMIAMGLMFWMPVYAIAYVVSTWTGGRFKVSGLLYSSLAGGIGGLVGGIAAALVFGAKAWDRPPEYYAIFAVPLSLAGLLVSKQIVVGLASHSMSDAYRESNARFSAWLLITILGWIAAMGLALWGPQLAEGAYATTERLIGFGGTAGVLAALLAASSRIPSTRGPDGQTRGILAKLRPLVVAIATPVFAGVVIILVSMLNARILQGTCASLSSPWCHAELATLNAETIEGGLHPAPWTILLATLALAGIGVFLGRRIDTNRFSLHAMYRVRLVRTFLGASKPPGERQPNPFTGFDETDDMPMSELWPARTSSESKARPPLHVINIALNTVAENDLATQSRKATSFTATSMHAGSASVGYRRTSSSRPGAKLYGGKDGVSLGTMMAVSGAAASPNSGYHSSPTVTFLMTLFNARLGWWLGNPGAAGNDTFYVGEPRLAIVPIISEMLGRTTERSPYVYLSDGGHFENLGLYEMVRRRCRFIVVSDAGCDPKCAFDDLGGAIRKIRIDFGIPIEFEDGVPIHSRTAAGRPEQATYWAVGRIHYSDVDGGDCDGVLLYIKPAFYGANEPRDVFNYASSRPEYPHESTGNQFFGEAEVESYRALGAFITDDVAEKVFGAKPDGAIDDEQFDAWLRRATMRRDAAAGSVAPDVARYSPSAPGTLQTK